MKGLDTLLSENIDFTRHVFNDPRVHYMVNDGRRYLYANLDKNSILFLPILSAGTLRDIIISTRSK